MFVQKDKRLTLIMVDLFCNESKAEALPFAFIETTQKSVTLSV